MKSINEVEWKIHYIPERLILKNKQNYKISYLLSKIFLEKKYSNEEIHNTLFEKINNNINCKFQDFVLAGDYIIDCKKNKKKVLIFGDYDVDGYSSTYLLYDFFSNLKIDCQYYIPDRLIDGYGPNKLLLKKLIKKNNYDLIIFVDCGSNSKEEISFLERLGLKIIVIDHHQIYERKNYNNAIIINPLKNTSLNNYTYFCATSLVYFFIKYLITILKVTKKIDLNKYLFFSAIATICDQMPLRGYNRLIVKDAFNNFNFNKFNNLKKIINIKDKITSSYVGFTLGPILNSASRLGYPNLPISLLVEKNNLNIDKIIKKLIFLNNKRKQIQNKTINLLKSESDLSKNEIIFKYKENINEGLLGIIASNFVELYNKPTFILTNSNNLIKCSARSISGYNIGNIFYYAIKKGIIINGGGHSMAAGCTLKRNKLIQFKKLLNKIYKKKFSNDQNVKYFSSEQSFKSLFLFAKKELQSLEPLGNNNINPFFLVKKNKIIKYKIIKNFHIQMIIKNKYNSSCLCFAFNAIDTRLGDILMNSKKEIDLIVQINNKNIRKNSDFNLIIKDAIA